jgi:HEAT repeat protein
VGFFGIALFAVVFSLLDRGPRPPRPWPDGSSNLGGTRPGVQPVKYDPIKEEEFPTLLKELQDEKTSLPRQREIAGRLGETAPTNTQELRHRQAKTLRKAWEAKKAYASEAAVTRAEEIDDIQHVSNALDPLLKEKDLDTREAVTKALTRWGTKKNVEGLIPLTEASGGGAEVVRINACKALGKIRDPRGLQPVLKRLTDQWDGSRGVVDAMIAFGPMAEDTVLPLLERDRAARAQAITILVHIGTEKSLAKLEPYENDRVAGRAVKKTMETIRARCAKKDEEADK